MFGLSFSNPWVLAGLIPFVLLLWWLRRRIQLRPRDLTSYLLLERAQRKLGMGKELPPKPAWSWWRRLLPLLLLGIALAGPHWVSEQESVSALILLDDSPSMSLGDRQALGLAEALALPGMAKAEVVRVAADSSTPSKLSVRAEAFAASGRSVAVVTDQLPLADLAAGVSWLAMANGEANVGIVAAGFDDLGQQLLLRVAATNTLKGEGTLRLLAEAPPLSSAVSPKEVWKRTLSAQQLPWRFVLELDSLSESSLASATELRLELAWEGDAAAFDNRASFEKRSAQFEVAILRSEATALRRAFQALPQCRVVMGSEAPKSAALVVEGAGHDEGFSLRVAPRLQKGAGWKLVGKQARTGIPLTLPPLISPLPRSLALPEVWELEASPPIAQNLVTIDGAPLIIRAGKEIVFLQDPQDESWSNDPSFPLLLAELMVHLGISSSASWQRVPRAPLSLAESIGPFSNTRIIASASPQAKEPPREAQSFSAPAPHLSLVPYLVGLALCLFLWMECFRAQRTD